ncbi:MAG: hypothetical protein WED34_12155 [Planctomycetales bacterium]
MRRLIALSTIAILSAAGPAVPAADAQPARTEAEQQAIAEVRRLGGSVMDLAQNDPRLVVAYHLADQKATDEQLAPLAKLPQIVELNLRGTDVTDEGLRQIAGLKGLVRLHLEKTKIGDAGLAHLKGLENLEYLNLYGTQVTDEGLKQLSGLKKLKKVYVWETQVTETGADALKKALPEVAVIRGAALAPEPEKPADPKKEQK